MHAVRWGCSSCGGCCCWIDQVKAIMAHDGAKPYRRYYSRTVCVIIRTQQLYIPVLDIMSPRPPARLQALPLLAVVR